MKKKLKIKVATEEFQDAIEEILRIRGYYTVEERKRFNKDFDRAIIEVVSSTIATFLEETCRAMHENRNPFKKQASSFCSSSIHEGR